MFAVSDALAVVVGGVAAIVAIALTVASVTAVLEVDNDVCFHKVFLLLLL